MAADSLLGQLSELATPQVLDQVSKMTGVDTSKLSAGLGAAGAATLGSMANTASTSDGLSSLMDMVNTAGAAPAGGSSGGTDALSSALGSLTGGGDQANALLGSLVGSATGGSGPTSATGITDKLMGSGINAISGTLSSTLGFNVKPMLTMVAPVLLGMVTKAVKSGNLDPAGLQKMLTDQSKAFMDDPANAETAKLVNSALEAGKESAANQAKYTDSGIAAIKAAPLAAMALVTAASPSKGGGAAAEFAAAAGSISQAAGKASPTSLLNGLFGAGVSQEQIDAAVSRVSSGDSMAVIKAGVDQVAQGNPDEVAAYKAMILSTAQATAEATKEGGFLGMGGKQVSPEEQAVLDQLKKTLG